MRQAPAQSQLKEHLFHLKVVGRFPQAVADPSWPLPPALCCEKPCYSLMYIYLYDTEDKGPCSPYSSDYRASRTAPAVVETGTEQVSKTPVSTPLILFVPC